MKYFGFLARFIVIPLIVIRLLIWWERRQQRTMPEPLNSWPEEAVLAGHAVVAVTYTTPWDNYLVATGVWDYDPQLVTGMTIGWVPIEEYTFFVLQSWLTGSWIQYLARHIPIDATPYPADKSLGGRLLATAGLGVIWGGFVLSMISGKRETTYRDLIMSWALPPIMFQVAFGGDILWKHRALVASSLFSATAYLGIADSLAIASGTWKITSDKTIDTPVINNLPFEELLFFFMTNVLLTFGVTLVQAKESENRLPAAIKPAYFDWKKRLTGGE